MSTKRDQAWQPAAADAAQVIGTARVRERAEGATASRAGPGMVTPAESLAALAARRDAHAAAMRDRCMTSAGIPETLRRCSLRTVQDYAAPDVEGMTPDAVQRARVDALARQVAAARERGVILRWRSNRDAIALLAGWARGRGSAWIHGGVGSGKTTLLAAWAVDLTPDQRGRAWYAVHRDGRRQGPYADQRMADAWRKADPAWSVTAADPGWVPHPVRWVDHVGFVEALRRSWGDDPGAIHTLAGVPVLALDDVGAGDMRPDSKMSAAVQEALSFVIQTRYDRGLPIVATSNYPIEAAGPVLGARALSRLIQMTRGSVAHVAGGDLRAFA